MNDFEFSTSLQIPVFQLDTRITYTEVKKPSGLMYILMIITSELSNEETKLVETLKSLGIPEDLHDMMADALEELIAMDVVKLKGKKPFSSTYFKEYRTNEFTLSAYGADLLRKQLIPTKVQKSFERSLYYIVPEETLTLDAKDLQTFQRMLPIKTYQGKKPMTSDELKNKIDEFPNKSISSQLSKHDMLKTVELPDDNIKHIQQKRDIRLTISLEGKMTLSFDDRLLNDFLAKNYSKTLIETLFKEKKKFKFMVKVDPIVADWHDLGDIKSIDFPENLNKTDLKKSLILGKTDDKSSNVTFSTKSLEKGLQAVRKGIWTVYWANSGLWYRLPVKMELPETTTQKNIKLDWVVDIHPTREEKNRVYDLLEDELCKSLNDDNNWKIAYKADKLLKSERFVPKMYEEYENRFDDASWLALLNNQYDVLKHYTGIQHHINDCLENAVKGIEKDNRDSTLAKIDQLRHYSTLNKNEIIKLLLNNYQPDTRIEILKFFTSLSEHGYDNEEVFNALNVPSILLQAISQGESLSDYPSKKVAPFITFNEKLGGFKETLSMADPNNYRIPFEAIEWKAFKEDYRILNKSFQALKTYKGRNQKAFNHIASYMDSLSEILETVNIYYNPSAIKNMSLSKLKTYAYDEPDRFLIHFHQRMERVLKKRYNLGDMTYSDMLKELENKKALTKSQMQKVHTFRKTRNKYIHENELKVLKSEDIDIGLQILFDLEEGQ